MPDVLQQGQEKSPRVIHIGAVDDGMSSFFAERVAQLVAEDPSADITLIINSYGGFVYEMLAMYAVMESAPCDFKTVAIAKAMSAGAFLLIMGTPGKRFAFPNTRILIHEAWGIVAGSVPDAKNEVADMDAVNEEALALMAGRMGFTADELKKQIHGEDSRQDWYLTPEGAAQIGVIDEIVSDLTTVFPPPEATASQSPTEPSEPPAPPTQEQTDG